MLMGLASKLAAWGTAAAAAPAGAASLAPDAPSAPPMPGGALSPPPPPQQQYHHQQQQQQQQRQAYPGPRFYPAPPSSRPSGGGAGFQSILARLQQIVQVNGLQTFYPPEKLRAVAQRVANIDFGALAARWRMPADLALDFSALALYDVIIYCDDSGSMAFEDGGERIEDLRLILGRAAEVCTLFDDDGILVRFMHSPVQGDAVRSAADASALLGQVRFCGTTPLASSMRSRVLEPIVYALAARGQLAKPVMVISITDGEPTDTPRDAILQVIREARALLAPQFGPKAVAFQFAQVGRDARAQAFLSKLDKDPCVGDVIDCTSYYEMECEEYARKGVALSVEVWMLKLLLGAIDPSYDAEDEG